ncbi:MAG: hypothetical protein KY468_10460 [Armatimonadetes bacterium]|nr:hypothetical protein [Armatimonadota bacterium]
MLLNYPSPDRQHTAVLKNIGEIRFGPSYYSLRLDRIDFGTRIFGNSALWSSDSRFLAVQEWLTIDEAEGPQTQLLLIDWLHHTECAVSWAIQGFIEPKRFEGNTLIYTKMYLARGITGEFEIDFLELDRWMQLKAGESSDYESERG